MVECDWTGTGDAATWACCNLENQCGFGEGDCDSSYQCEGNLICGIDNCQAMNPTKTFSINADCCYDPSKHFVFFYPFEHFYNDFYIQVGSMHLL